MSQPVHDLQRLIASQQPVSGRVVAITGGTVRVATAQGVVEVSGAGLSVGDQVVVKNGKVDKIRQNGAANILFV
ncbi:hypothetical protein [Magnetofaba australis]|uniref:Uncharacterized protein n=1 Tax=Magnetofaba australis IT-1 TaxID=1434232 RepID=A0A1Y2KBZ0_9PROT|nr:hypothetical protein [Magnetofaba australis]OSM07645.1 hypothetical protein MAIT1_04594 [Magnetofaba australis IT-1]